MELVKWNPFGRNVRVRNQIDSFFDEFFHTALCIDEGMAANAWNPAVDVYENKEDIVIKVELPGVEKKDIKVDVNDGILTLKGERNNEKEVKEEAFYRRESVYGKFERSFKLPDGTDFDKIKADFKDGILKVSVPKTEEKLPKQITIH
ncbi:MAG: Hsp20/alpha crystallin family protein [Deltaproteobacteria bacterium]|nr:Hsp20/alpha crystallin family protein [Deltaproteobacteria bacterium]